MLGGLLGWWCGVPHSTPEQGSRFQATGTRLQNDVSQFRPVVNTRSTVTVSSSTLNAMVKRRSKTMIRRPRRSGRTPPRVPGRCVAHSRPIRECSGVSGADRPEHLFDAPSTRGIRLHGVVNRRDLVAQPALDGRVALLQRAQASLNHLVSPTLTDEPLSTSAPGALFYFAQHTTVTDAQNLCSRPNSAEPVAGPPLRVTDRNHLGFTVAAIAWSAKSTVPRNSTPRPGRRASYQSMASVNSFSAAGRRFGKLIGALGARAARRALGSTACLGLPSDPLRPPGGQARRTKLPPSPCPLRPRRCRSTRWPAPADLARAAPARHRQSCVVYRPWLERSAPASLTPDPRNSSGSAPPTPHEQRHRRRDPERGSGPAGRAPVPPAPLQPFPGSTPVPELPAPSSASVVPSVSVSPGAPVRTVPCQDPHTSVLPVGTIELHRLFSVNPVLIPSTKIVVVPPGPSAKPSHQMLSPPGLSTTSIR